MARPVVAEIDLDRICHNFRIASSITPRGNTIAVVKADAYGHGVTEVCKALASAAPAFATASIEEAMVIRKAGLLHPVLLLEGFFDSYELSDISVSGFWTVVHNEFQIRCLEVERISKPISVWLKIDTGMSRLGFPVGEAENAFRRLKDNPNVRNIVIMTHLANADAGGSTLLSVNDQIARIPRMVLEPEGQLSIANSAGLLAHEVARRSWQRPGIMLYGSSPLNLDNEYSRQLLPAMTLKSRIIATRWIEQGGQVGYGGRFIAPKRTRVGTVAVGYADGYPRQAAEGTPVFVSGRRVGLVGRVSMDMLTVDITDIPDVDVGAEVELWGDNVLANEVASSSGTIAYHLFTSVTRRVRRIYKSSSAVERLALPT